jgi:hypothetical protein
MPAMDPLRTRLTRPQWLTGPTRWLVLAEAAVMAAFLIAAWRVWDARQTPPAPAAAAPIDPSPSATPASRPPATPMPLPTATGSAAPPGGSGALPGLRTDAPFVGQLLEQANRVESELEHAEWRAVAALRDGARSYLLNHVAPDVQRALSGGRDSG